MNDVLNENFDNFNEQLNEILKKKKTQYINDIKDREEPNWINKFKNSNEYTSILKKRDKLKTSFNDNLKMR